MQAFFSPMCQTMAPIGAGKNILVSFEKDLNSSHFFFIIIFLQYAKPWRKTLKSVVKSPKNKPCVTKFVSR